MTSETLEISGMHCGGCVRTVTNVLKRVAGVQSVDISLPENSAKVEYNETETTVDEIRKILRSSGYDIIRFK